MYLEGLITAAFRTSEPLLRLMEESAPSGL